MQFELIYPLFLKLSILKRGICSLAVFSIGDDNLVMERVQLIFGIMHI